MPTVYSLPTLSDSSTAWRMWGGGPPHHQVAKAKYLAAAGWETIDAVNGADVVHVHGVRSYHRMDVLTIHAIWPTHIYDSHPTFWDDHNMLMAAAMQRAGRVVTLSEYTAQLCREIAGVDVVVIPQAIDPDEWTGGPTRDTRHDLGIAPGVPLVVWGKNSVDILRDPSPAVTLATHRSDIAVVLTATETEVRGAAGHVPRNVHCVGALSFPDMRNLLYAADIYLATTIESSGQGHLEAMTLGKPIIGYNWGGVAETVPVGRYGAGVLVDPHDVVGLIDSFDLVWKKRSEYGKKAKATSGAYSWPTVVHQLIDTYNEVRK